MTSPAYSTRKPQPPERARRTLLAKIDVDLLDMLAWARPRLSPPPRGRGRPANEHASYPHEVKEAVLAHALKNKVEAAYRRTDLFDKRRELMDARASFASSAGAKVVRLEA